MMRPVPQHERGAALLAVLVLVAIMGAIAAAAFEKLRLSTALAVNGAALDQARAYAVGVEHLLTVRVDDLLAESPEATTLDGNWNGVKRPIPLPGDGLAEGTIRDGGNCFNLNSLVEGNERAGWTARPLAAAQFVALMESIGIVQEEARRIADSATDWADGDSAPSAFGAEDAVYAGAERPYRPANTLFAERSELRAVAGVTPDLYARLKPFICALPANDLSPINANTLLPEQAPLLAMLAPGMVQPAQARALIASRPAGGWRALDDFWADATGAGVMAGGEGMSQVALVSRWFTIDLRVAYGGAELLETALVDARMTPSRIAARRWGPDE